MTVGVHRNGYAGMAQSFRDDLRMDSAGEQEGGVGMAEVVESAPRVGAKGESAT